MSGVKKIEKKYNKENPGIDISTLTEGIYILSVKTGKETYTKKLFIH